MRIRTPYRGFTLIELSVVLVIIGLLFGSILVGRQLIRGSEIRAQISQMEKLQAATIAFENKYSFLPGDIKDPQASKFGFQPRGTHAGEGDGNGIIEGVYADADSSDWGTAFGSGETIMFWVDLSTASLFEGSFTSGSPTTPATIDLPTMDKYFPKSKVSGSNYIYVWSGGPAATGTGLGTSDRTNYFGISRLSHVDYVYVDSTPGISVYNAYSIDKKMDDGLPQSGDVVATYVKRQNPLYASWAGVASGTNGPTTTATSGSSTTCYDNGGVAGGQQYSVKQGNGVGLNCALSFKFRQ